MINKRFINLLINILMFDNFKEYLSKLLVKE